MVFARTETRPLPQMFQRAMVVLACCVGSCGTSNAIPEDGRWFVDAAATTGLAFTHQNGRSGKFRYPEVIAPGAGLFDSDNDGDLDLLLVQGADLESPADVDAPDASRSRLFRNDLAIRQDGSRALKFVDVTDASGIAVSGYGMGVAAGDYDNDGCADVYITSLERNYLLHNDCKGRFLDVSQASGTQGAGWSVSAAFIDFDRDGWLDLFAGHYLTWALPLDTPCRGSSGRRQYCAPEIYRAQQSRLYRNNRNGAFVDVTTAAGLATQFGPALGVASADFNGDGWMDFYVANDGEENQLWMNERDGRFVNRAPLAGVALGSSGRPKAGMGVDAADFDEDGDEDLIVANLAGEGHDLYINDGSASFVNGGATSGISHRTLPYTGFGTGWLDVDNDGWLDLLTVNGAVQVPDSLVAPNATSDLAQPPQLFRNLGNGRFEDATHRAGVAALRLDAGRGAAFGDIDNDGDTDIVVANNGGPVRLLLNAIGQNSHWVGLRLVGRNGRDSLGARVAITTKDSRTRWRRARADGSYASANDPRVLAGLGDDTGPVRVRVTWPGGGVEEWPRVEIDRYTTLVEGGAVR